VILTAAGMDIVKAISASVGKVGVEQCAINANVMRDVSKLIVTMVLVYASPAGMDDTAH
jgi:hypothetical protein